MSDKLLARLKSPGPKRILALDGGGIRGAITLGFLKQIEDTVRARLGPEARLCDYFDFIGGTSTGSIIAALLAVGKDVASIQQLYLELGERVFGNKKNFFGRIYATFDEKSLETLLREQLGDHTTLGSETIRSGLCIVTTRADTSSTWPLLNHPEGKFYQDNQGILLHKAVRASTAAPTYFIPEKIDVGGGQIGAFVDGGVSSHNCPAYYMFLAATLKSFPFHWKTGPDDLLIVSIGTGNARKRRKVDEVANSKLWNWAKEAPDLFMTDSAKLNQITLQYLGKNLKPNLIDSEIGDMAGDSLNGGAFSYVRYNVTMEENELNRLGFPGQNLVSLREMSNAQNVGILSEIGVKAAADQFKPEHLPKAFDL